MAFWADMFQDRAVVIFNRNNTVKKFKKVHVENRFFLRLFFSSIILVLLKGRFFYEISTIIFK